VDERTGMSEIVRLTGVTKRYERGGPAALDGVDLSVPAGDAVAVTGPSGSGKSTLLSLIAGLDRPTTGTVEVAGEDLGRLSERGLARFRRARIGIIFQFFNLLDDLTVRDNVMLPAQLAGTPPARARSRAEELLQALGIAGHGGAYPARLSGGERQRVAIARALVNRPAVLLADEPTGAVDAATGAKVAQILLELAQDGHTLMMVTHDSALARRCARRVLTIVDGRLGHDRDPAVAR
jgi:putative ABC transport system ATP-binding protein